MSKDLDYLKKQVKVVSIETITTSEYGIDVFKALPINRTLKRHNILKLVRAFKQVHPNNVSILTVIVTCAWDGTQTAYLCDGHHRREAALLFASEIGTTVPLTFNLIKIDGKDTIENVGKVLETINVNLGTWSPKDFTSHNAKMGLSDYQEFETLAKEHNMGESTMLDILGLGQYTMADYKAKKFKITNRKKSNAILEVLKKVGFNDPKIDKYDAFPHSYIKRTLIRKLISLDLPEIKLAVSKVKDWLKENESFDYEEQVFKKQLDEIFDEVEETAEV